MFVESIRFTPRFYELGSTNENTPSITAPASTSSHQRAPTALPLLEQCKIFKKNLSEQVIRQFVKSVHTYDPIDELRIVAFYQRLLAADLWVRHTVDADAPAGSANLTSLPQSSLQRLLKPAVTEQTLELCKQKIKRSMRPIGFVEQMARAYLQAFKRYYFAENGEASFKNAAERQRASSVANRIKQRFLNHCYGEVPESTYFVSRDYFAYAGRLILSHDLIARHFMKELHANGLIDRYQEVELLRNEEDGTISVCMLDGLMWQSVYGVEQECAVETFLKFDPKIVMDTVLSNAKSRLQIPAQQIVYLFTVVRSIVLDLFVRLPSQDVNGVHGDQYKKPWINLYCKQLSEMFFLINHIRSHAEDSKNLVVPDVSVFQSDFMRAVCYAVSNDVEEAYPDLLRMLSQFDGFKPLPNFLEQSHLILLAVLSKDAAALRSLAAAGVDVNALERHGLSIKDFAASLGCNDLISTLAER